MLIVSKKNPKKILGAICKYKDVSVKRKNISPIKEFLQVSTQKLKKNFSIKSHIHLKNNRKVKLTQELWILMQGKISVQIFDIDKKKIKNFLLEKGDFYILYNGGHSFKVLSKEAIFFEIKKGPYDPKLKDIRYLKK